MRDDTHGGAVFRASVERVFQHGGEARRAVFNRTAPVVSQLHHLVVGGERRREAAIDVEQAVGHDPVVPAIRELAGFTADVAIEPDAATADREVTAKNIRHEDQRRPAGGRRTTRYRPRAARAGRGRAAPRQRTNRGERRRAVLHQRIHDRTRRVIVGEIVEVVDASSLVQQEGRLVSRRAAVHRARLHDEVVVGPEEGVREQRLHPARDRIAVDVAGDNAQIAGKWTAARVQPLDQGTVGDLGRQPGKLRRVGPPARDLGKELDKARRRRDAGEIGGPLQHGQVCVQPSRTEQCSACGARDPHQPLDGNPLPRHGSRQLLQLSLLCGVALP